MNPCPIRRPRAPERARAALAEIRQLGLAGMWPGATLIWGRIQLWVLRSGGQLNLKEIWVSPEVRGEGWGRKALALVLEIAQKHHVAVQLRIEPYGYGPRIGVRALRAWYGSMGFETTEGRCMLWSPRDDPPPPSLCPPPSARLPAGGRDPSVEDRATLRQPHPPRLPVRVRHVSSEDALAPVVKA